MFSNKLYLISILILSVCSKAKNDFTENCPLLYTVDLSESVLLQNWSYLYNNDTVIPPQFIKDYNDTTLVNNNQTSLRGCICAVKQCLPVCSDHIEIFYDVYHVDAGYSKNVTFSSGVLKLKHIIHDFHLIYVNVCESDNEYMLQPETEHDNHWTLYENSVLLRHSDQRNFTITEYCFDINLFDDNNNFAVNPVVCGEPIGKHWFKIYAMVFSIPFLVITIICYCTLIRSPVAINKCFIVYLLFVTISYTLICSYNIADPELPDLLCRIFGFSVYFTIIGYLTWTCIISYDTWKSLTDISNNKPSFLNYCLIGFLIPMLMTFLTYLAQIWPDMPNNWRPGMTSDMCAVNTLRESAIIYYYIPCLFVFVFSLTLYISIVLFKNKHNEELTALFGHGPEPMLERFVLFFRIFIFMGISWSLDIISYFCRMAFGSEEYFIYLALDLFNAFHGFLVFLAFICRPSVLKEIKKLCRSSKRNWTEAELNIVH